MVKNTKSSTLHFTGSSGNASGDQGEQEPRTPENHFSKKKKKSNFLPFLLKMEHVEMNYMAA